MDAMIAEAAARDDVDLSLVGVDSTVARAHHHAAGMVVEPEREQRRAVRRRRRARLRAAEPGRSRGGLTGKVHLAVKVRVPVGRLRTRPDAVAGDKTYSSRANRADLRKRTIRAVIPEKKDHAANRRKKGRSGGRPPEFVHVHTGGSYLVAHAQGVERMEDVGRRLDARAEFGELGAAFQDVDPVAMAGDGERGGQSAPATTGDHKVRHRGRLPPRPEQRHRQSRHCHRLSSRVPWSASYGGRRPPAHQHGVLPVFGSMVNSHPASPSPNRQVPS